MKKLVLAAAVAVFGIAGVNAQTTGVEAGVHIGIPVGDVDDYSSFNVGLDVAYLHPISSNFKLGIASGYDHFIGKDDADDFGFIPLAASAKFNPTQNFFVGLDLGYAFATNDNWEGGFYYQPKVGYSGALVDVFGFYKGNTTNYEVPTAVGTIEGRDINFGSVGAGVAYKF